MNARHMKLSAGAALVALVALALGFATVSAGNGATVSTSAVSWTVPAGQCADFPTEMNGTGTFRSSSAVKTGPSGITTIMGAVHASGTASDADGNSYHWSYAGQWLLANTLADPNTYGG